MGQEEEDRPENSKELRELARRVRVIASALSEAEQQRLLAYADELEVLANRIDGESPL
jgi:hypothetical protein